MKIIVSFFLFLCLCLNMIHAQGSVSGKVVDTENKPVDYFNLTLLNSKDSTMITSAAFTNGVFALKNMKAQSYELKISSFGYATTKQFIEIKEGENLLPIVVLQPTAIKEITVIAQRPAIQNLPDRTVVSIVGSVLANTLNGNDMLQKTPGLIKDPNGELIVAGKGVPKYYIDGKEVHSATELKMLNPQNVRSIEILDNPPASYDADGHAIVLINMIKHTEHYLLRLGSELNQSHRTSGSAFVEGVLTTGAVTSNLYLDHSVSNNKTFESNYSVFDANRTMDTHAMNVSNDPEYSYHLAVDVELSKGQNLNFQSNGSVMNNYTLNRTQFTHFSDTLLANFNTYSQQNEKNWQTNNTISYINNIDTLGQRLKVVGDLTLGQNESNSDYSNVRIGEENQTPFWNTNWNKGIPSIYSIKGDYSKPLSKNASLDTGLKYYSIISDNRTNLTGSTNLQQHYRTNEQNIAAYASFSLKFNKKLEMRVGLRAENTFRKAIKDGIAYLDTIQFGLFPSALLNYNLSDKFSGGISYSKRISRPTFSALDPSLWVDSLTNRQGNPNLKSTEIHSFQVSLKLYSMLSLRVGYNYYLYPIYFLIYKDALQPQLSDVRFENGDKMGRFTGSMSFNKQLFNWWSTSVYASFFTNSYLYFDTNNQQRNNNIPGKSITVQNSLTVLKDYAFDMGWQFNGSGSWATIKNEPYWNLYFSIQRSFFKKSLTCTLTANDLFNTMVSHQHSVLRGQNLNIFDQDDRYVGISIKYQIGKSNYNYSSKSETTEERQRIH